MGKNNERIVMMLRISFNLNPRKLISSNRSCKIIPKYLKLFPNRNMKSFSFCFILVFQHLNGLENLQECEVFQTFR